MPEAEGALIDEFCDALWLEDGLARLTLDAYRRDLTQLALWLAQNGKGFVGATEENLRDYIRSRHGAGAKATSANRRLSSCKRFFRWMVRQNRRDSDPSAHLDSARQSQRFPRILSEASIEALLAAPDIDTTLGLRDRAMLELLYASGLRVSELVSARTVEVSLSDQVVRITAGKGGKTRLVPFGEEAAAWIARYLADARPVLLGTRSADALFVTARGAAMTRHNFWHTIKRLALVAGIAQLATAWLRYTPDVFLDYARALYHVADMAQVMEWKPYQMSSLRGFFMLFGLPSSILQVLTVSSVPMMVR